MIRWAALAIRQVNESEQAGFYWRKNHEAEKPFLFGDFRFFAWGAPGECPGARYRLKGTSLAPDAKAKAEVKRKEGQSTIKFRAKNLPPASLLRREVSTYVLWSFDPVRQEYFNLGEVRVGSSGDEKGKAETVTRTALKRFRLLVTAEPNVNVSRPSDLEVLRSKK